MKKVIIIGAGPAGLTAGYELVKDGNEDYEVVILEETEEIGGIKVVNGGIRLNRHGNQRQNHCHTEQQRQNNFYKVFVFHTKSPLTVYSNRRTL